MKKIFTLLSYAFIILMAIITVFPFLYMILASLMTYGEVVSIPPTLIPANLMFSNFADVVEKAPFVRYFFNTTLVATVSTAFVLFNATLAAFALVKLDFKGKNLVVMLMISLLMIPYEATVFTNFQTISRLQLVDTYTGLIIPGIVSVFYTYYLKNYLSSVPLSYYKAAKIDGASDLEFIRRIMLPLARPALVTVGILCFISNWNSFLWPLLVTNDKMMRLLNNGLSFFATEAGSEIHLQLAASTITIVPILIIYFVFRKQIIEGVASNGIKG